MKIGVFSNYYPPGVRGGAERIAQRVADELAARGHAVFVLTTMPFDGMSSLTPRVCESHVERVYRFYPLNLYHASHAHRVPFPVRLLWHFFDVNGPFPHQLVDRVLQAEEPDVVLTHNLKGLGVRAARCIQDAGVRHIHTLHDIQLSVPSGVLIYGQEQAWVQRTRARGWYERMARHALGSPDLVISPSQFLADFYRERGFFAHTPVSVLSNPAPQQREIPADRPMPSGPIRLLYIGQLETHKGVDLLLRAVRACTFPFELHIAGEGALSARVAQEAAQDPHVFTHGFISLEHIRHLMHTMDAVVLPSLCYENSPTVLYEAFQAGLPVLASRIGGIPELVREGENGRLFAPGNLTDLCATLEGFAKQRQTFYEKQNGIRAYAKQFSLGAYVEKLERLMHGDAVSAQ